MNLLLSNTVVNASVVTQSVNMVPGQTRNVKWNAKENQVSNHVVVDGETPFGSQVVSHMRSLSITVSLRVVKIFVKPGTTTLT